jgi:enoyl-CoA hydratase
MTGPFDTILVDTPQPNLLRVTLNRPDVANAFNTRMMEELLAFWSGLDATHTRCVILTGAGERVFCAGADLKERNGMTDAQWMAQHVIIERQYAALIATPVPVIAAVNGHAFAGGLELVLACDFAYAVSNARFALTEVTLGIMPGAGGTQTLARAAGERRAKEIILTGRPFGAAEARDWGIVNALHGPEGLMDATLDTASRIASNAPLAIREARRAIHNGLAMTLEDGMRCEIDSYNRLVPTGDRREGVRAFNEKRKPRFAGR